MKSKEEIKLARQYLMMVFDKGSELQDCSEEEWVIYDIMMDTICWILDHKHPTVFADELRKAKDKVEKLGINEDFAKALNMLGDDDYNIGIVNTYHKAKITMESVITLSESTDVF